MPIVNILFWWFMFNLVVGIWFVIRVINRKED